MPKYFLDGGAHDGCSIRLFRTVISNSDEYVIHSFEPNPEFRDQLSRIPGVIFHQAAIWIEDCEAPFFMSRAAMRDGSTLIASKTTGELDRANPITVRCINFGQWINRTFQEDDLLILKLDIEGAEYEVLRSMLKDGSIHKINRLYIEFHGDRTGVAKEEHDHLLTELKKLKLAISAWDALGH
jgi:FkbM family methyltransferase